MRVGKPYRCENAESLMQTIRGCQQFAALRARLVPIFFLNRFYICLWKGQSHEKGNKAMEH
jgi:hypothetical protein